VQFLVQVNGGKIIRMRRTKEEYVRCVESNSFS